MIVKTNTSTIPEPKLNKLSKNTLTSFSIKKIVYLHLFYVFYFEKLFAVYFIIVLVVVSFVAFIERRRENKTDTLNGAKYPKRLKMFVYSQKQRELSSIRPKDILPLKSKSSVKIWPMRLKPKSETFLSDMCVSCISTSARCWYTPGNRSFFFSSCCIFLSESLLSISLAHCG